MASRRSSREPSLLGICLCLLPFVLSCIQYFLLWLPADRPSLTSALVKALPVLSLAFFSWIQEAGSPSAPWVRLGLLLSALGDVCLVWPNGFIYGMASFAVAHVLYIWTFGLRPARLGLLPPVGLAFGAFYAFLLPHLPPALAVPVAGYMAILGLVVWRGLARGGRGRTLGALLFTLSDSVLTLDAFVSPVPAARAVVMTTYYAAQCFLALTVVEHGHPSPKAE
ncbi:lysoplasmalogenase [Tachyglossus aculeatus]|uniref:lysoplasmalogenase n=1 Tax=Tachyglossus aculeatus TaxID=9261 RepID=UPI0018F56B9C|nr:lysoplasmalogenase [Tachyglossus aculeatus]